MHVESVEIYSDASNTAIMRHPARRYPGVLIQGDSLHILCTLAGACLDRLSSLDDDDVLNSLRELHEILRDHLRHYAAVLTEHGISLPYHDGP